ncbi:MAG: RNA methyltransferase [Bacteroidetes bacterium]|nr:RNA methyltransferase [Bacteroidota bacterium]
MHYDIQSPQNDRIRQVCLLEKPRERRKQGLFVVEGVREVSLALGAGLGCRELFICPDLYQADPLYPIDLEGFAVLTVSPGAFAKMAYREDSGGVLALVPTWEPSLERLPEGDGPPLYLILEKVEKPGNIGAMLRTADAARIHGVIVCEPATDVFNPNVVRSSLGTLFTIPLAVASSEQTLQWCEKHGIRPYAAALDGAISYTEAEFTGPSAIVMGSEKEGLGRLWLDHSHARVQIPMRGRIDSMNVSVAAAILVFEALRQRGG